MTVKTYIFTKYTTNTYRETMCQHPKYDELVTVYKMEKFAEK